MRQNTKPAPMQSIAGLLAKFAGVNVQAIAAPSGKAYKLGKVKASRDGRLFLPVYFDGPGFHFKGEVLALFNWLKDTTKPYTKSNPWPARQQFLLDNLETVVVPAVDEGMTVLQAAGLKS